LISRSEKNRNERSFYLADNPVIFNPKKMLPNYLPKVRIFLLQDHGNAAKKYWTEPGRRPTRKWPGIGAGPIFV
jgi:hypothetical protein